MSSQELLSYVKEQIAAGTARERIYADLKDEGGWSTEDIDEVFQTIEYEESNDTPECKDVSTFEIPPTSISYFKWLMYASIIASMLISIASMLIGAFQYDPAHVNGQIFPSLLIVLILKSILVQRVVYHKARWARMVLVVLTTLTALSIAGLFSSLSDPYVLLLYLPLVLEIIAMVFVFRTSSSSWIAMHKSSTDAWSRTIPSANTRSLTLSAILVFGLDLIILLLAPQLAEFFVAMLMVLGVFGIFLWWKTMCLPAPFQVRTPHLMFGLLVWS